MDWFLNCIGNYDVCFYIETKLQIDDDTQRKTIEIIKSSLNNVNNNLKY